MRIERERQVEAERQAAKEEVLRMEAERRAAVMIRPLEFSFRLCEIDFSFELSFRLTFQISDWLQIAFRFISDCCLKKS